MAFFGAAFSQELHCLRGTYVLDHLAADGTGLAAGQIAVVALLQVDADLRGGLHLEAVHRLAGVGVHKIVGTRHVRLHSFPVHWTARRTAVPERTGMRSALSAYRFCKSVRIITGNN